MSSKEKKNSTTIKNIYIGQNIYFNLYCKVEHFNIDI